MKKTISALAITIAAAAPTSIFAQTATVASLQELLKSLQEQIVLLQSTPDPTATLKEAQKLFTRSLRVGTKGDDVRMLQEYLAQDKAIYPEGLITGYFGSATERAVKKFQTRMGIESIGIVGPKTIARINEKLAENSAISGVRTSEITAGSARVHWTTRLPSNARIWYGTTTPLVRGNRVLAVESPTLVTDHELQLSALSPSSLYYYIVASKDEAGKTSTSTQYSFITPAN